MNANKKIITLTIATIVVFILMSAKKAFSKPTKSGKIRGCDPKGCGHYGASRGTRLHMGVDFVTAVGEPIYAPVSGKISALPYASADKFYRGVEITNGTEKHQLFYVKPVVQVGRFVTAGQLIGHSENLATKYGTSMTNHVHYEVTYNGKFINPTSLF